MKFSCDRCGKKYATAEAPAPGRVYKLKCKACGHVILVKTPASAAAVPRSSASEPSQAFESSPPAASQPEVDIEVEAPPRAAPASQPVTTPVPSRSGEPTQEISMMTPAGPAASDDGGYIDIFADSDGGATAEPPAAAPEPPPISDDPFLRAAGRAAGAPVEAAPERPDLFAAAREEPVHSPPAPAAAPFPELAPPPPRVEEKKKGGLPVVLIGVGFVAMVAIVVGVAMTSGKKAETVAAPAAPPKPAAAPAPAPPAPAPAPAPEPQKAEAAEAPAPKPEPKPEPKPAPPPEPRRREERRVVKAEPKPEPKPAPKPPPPPPPPPPPKPVARAEPERPVSLPEASAGLSPSDVQKVVNGSRRAFEACIDEAAKRGTDTAFDGRKVSLRLNVNPNGYVTYPTLDDVTLNRTDLGKCLKSAAQLMVFPRFEGDVVHIEVPLTLRAK